MISLRVAANLVAFVALAVVLSWWALSNHLTFGLTAPDRDVVVMEFAASPGLQPGSVVAYLGHPVGEVGRIELADDRVRVHTRVDPDQPVPADVVATVRRASAVGEPYVDLSPRGELADDPELLADGDVVALADTRVPRSYEEVFRAVADVLDAVPEDALATVVDELSLALDGREDELATLLADGQDVLDTAAARADLLDRLATESTDLAALAADLAPTAGAALDDLGPLTASLAEARADLVAVLEDAPGLAERVEALVVDSREPLACLLSSLDRSLTELDTPENRERLAAAIERSPDLIAALQSATHDRDTGPWLRVDAILNFGVGGSPVTTYTEPLPLPDTPTIPGVCARPDLGPGAPPPAPDGAVAPTPEPVAVDDAPAPVGGDAPSADPTSSPRADTAGEVGDGPGPDRPPWPWLVGGLAGFLVLAGAWRVVAARFGGGA